MARGINVLLTLVDKFSQPLRKVAGETKQTTRQIKNAQNMVNKFAGGANEKFLSLAGSVAKIGMGIAAIGTGLAIAGAKNFADEAIEKANAQVAAETKLVTILGDVRAIQEQGAGAAERAAKSLGEYASQLQTFRNVVVPMFFTSIIPSFSRTLKKVDTVFGVVDARHDTRLLLLCLSLQII